MNLADWLRLAALDQESPLPPGLRTTLAKLAAEVARLALSPEPLPDRAAAELAKAAGLTPDAIRHLRAEQTALRATMILEFNRHQPDAPQVKALEADAAANYGVTPRQIRRWRERVMTKKDV